MYRYLGTRLRASPCGHFRTQHNNIQRGTPKYIEQHFSSFRSSVELLSAIPLRKFGHSKLMLIEFEIVKLKLFVKPLIPQISVINPCNVG